MTFRCRAIESCLLRGICIFLGFLLNLVKVESEVGGKHSEVSLLIPYDSCYSVKLFFLLLIIVVVVRIRKSVVRRGNVKLRGGRVEVEE